ncbi:MAG: hypothetical protein JW940_11840 [Polyangiaceae bacterium]|nr:hypothetical protein [Polyangiaceae bacterium]
MSTPARFPRITAALSAAVVAVSLSTEAGAADRMVISKPGVHPTYSVEAEPHLLLGLIDPPGPAHGTGLGIGARGTVEIVDNGFVSTINNTIGVGFGLDWTHYSAGPCPADGDDCRNKFDSVWIPLAMQWNFWLSEQWSVFGEPGVALRFGNSEFQVEPLEFWAGARWLFAEQMALTMRVGYPTFSVGVSFLM